MGEYASGIRFRTWTEEEFAAGSIDWQRLLQASDADPLFNSWDWQWFWWKHNAPLLDARLLLIAAYSAGGELIGLAPFYVRRARHKFFEAKRLELLGSAWRTDGAVFSEYLDIVVARPYAVQVAEGLARWLWKDLAWGDLVLSNLKPGSLAARLAAEIRLQGADVRTVDPLEAYAAALPSTFEEYVRKLASGTRRKLLNQRSKLVRPVLKRVAAEEVESFLDVVDDFHQVRWGKRQFTGVARAFHRDFAAQMARRDALRMTLLRTDAGLLSAMYNVRIGATEYNLQLGFDTALGAGLSPGYLHFGYCIEEACREGVQTFDFLAGQGQRRQYKADLLTGAIDVLTLQVIRSSLLQRMYRWHDALRSLRSPHSSDKGESDRG